MLRSLLKKLQKFLRPDLAEPRLVRVYPRMGYRPDLYMLRTEQLMSSDDWIYNIVPQEQIESMYDRAEQIERNMDNGLSIVLSADNQSAIEMCQYWKKSLKGDIEAAIKVTSFVSSIIATIETHLHEEGIDPYED